MCLTCLDTGSAGNIMYMNLINILSDLSEDDVLWKEFVAYNNLVSFYPLK